MAREGNGQTNSKIEVLCIPTTSDYSEVIFCEKIHHKSHPVAHNVWYIVALFTLLYYGKIQE